MTCAYCIPRKERRTSDDVKGSCDDQHITPKDLVSVTNIRLVVVLHRQLTLIVKEVKNDPFEDNDSGRRHTIHDYGATATKYRLTLLEDETALGETDARVFVSFAIASLPTQWTASTFRNGLFSICWSDTKERRAAVRSSS
jgi:hypothetical protein